MRDSVLSARYSSVCVVLRLWRISFIHTYRVYRLYDTLSTRCSVHSTNLLMLTLTLQYLMQVLMTKVIYHVSMFTIKYLAPLILNASQTKFLYIIIIIIIIIQGIMWDIHKL